MRCKYKNLLFITILTFYLAICYAYKGLIPPDPENPGKCIYRGDILELATNRTVPPCQRIYCNNDGSIQIEGCGKLRIANCNRGERLNTDKPYPACCLLKYKCKESDGTPYYIERNVAEDNLKVENAT